MKTKITTEQYKSMCKAREIADLRGCKPETAYTIGFYDGWTASVSEENSRLREALELILDALEFRENTAGKILAARDALEGK